MTHSRSVYDKSGSIVYVRQKSVGTPGVSERVRRVQTEAERQPESYRRSIVLQACRDLLGESPEGGRRFTLQDFVVGEISRLDDAPRAQAIAHSVRGHKLLL